MSQVEVGGGCRVAGLGGGGGAVVLWPCGLPLLAPSHDCHHSQPAGQSGDGLGSQDGRSLVAHKC